MRTSREVIRPYITQHPNHKFAITESELGVWIETENRFIPFASLTILGHWVYMPQEILVNGKRIARDWIEVQ